MDYSKASYAININDYRVVFRSEEVDANRNFIPVSADEAQQLNRKEVTPQELLRRHGYQALEAGDVAAQAALPPVPQQAPPPPPPAGAAAQGDPAVEEIPAGIENAVVSRDPPPVTLQETVPEGASVDNAGDGGAPPDIDGMSITALRVRCKSLGIAYPSTSKRVDLIALVRAHGAAGGEGG